MTGRSDDQRIHILFEQQVRRDPGRTALIVGVRRFGYAELNALANGIAQRLVDAGAGSGTLVGVCVDRDERLVAALLGVLKAGAAYVPLDPAWPEARLRFLVEDAGLTTVVAGADQLTRIKDLGATVVAAEGAGTGTDPDLPGAATDPAYVVYTSGSTGRPKGVVVEHGAAVNLITWGTATWSAGELAGNLAAASVSFDFSVTEIYPTLAAGGTVILADTLLDLPALPARDEVTMISGPPSALRALLHHGLPAGVRTVNSGGEALPAALVDALFEHEGVTRVRNLYGPSEITTLSHAWDLGRDAIGGGEPPIGVPVAGARALIRDAEGRPVADGEVGELWIAGPGVARGYLNRPELTAERFVTAPDVPGERCYRTGDLVRRVDGVDHYQGRADEQVKVRGFRVELGEVEAALAALEGVAAAVAVAPADEDGIRSLIGYVVPEPGAAPAEGALRAALSRELPNYLVPSRIGVLAAFPLASSGKIDRAALPALRPADPGVDFVAPRTALEAAVAAEVAGVLGAARVGVFDDFFEIGGDSLAAAKVAARVGAALRIRVPLPAFLAQPTVAALAARLAGPAAPEAGAAPGGGPVRNTGATEYPLLGSQWFMWAAPRMWPGATNTAGVALRIRGLTDAGHVRTALTGVIARHEIFRTMVAEREGFPVAVVQPPVVAPLAEVDLRDRPADEVPGLLAALTAECVRPPFDLAEAAPLLRGTVVWTGADTATLLLVVDHFAIDGYSLATVLDELATGIAAAAAGRPDPTPAPRLQVGDVALWEQTAVPDEAAAEELRAFWRAEIAGANSPNLPGELRSKGPVHGARVVRELGAERSARIEALRRACGVTRFEVFAAVLGIVLHRRTGHKDNLLGVISALRDRPGVDQVVGPLDDMLPLRLDVSGAPTFAQLTRRVARRSRDSLARQDLGIAEILKLVAPDRHPGDPLLPVFLSMQPSNVPVVVERDGIRVETLGEIDGGNIFCDLVVLVNETVDGTQIQLGYDTERFTAAAAEDFLAELLDVLDGVEADRPFPAPRP